MRKKKLIEGSDYVVRSLPLPPKSFDGCVVSDADGCCTIILNENVCPKRQKEALKHELWHLQNDDLYDDVSSVDEIEGKNPY